MTTEQEIKMILSTANLKTKISGGYGYHGSSKGDYIEYTLYWDVLKADWTNRDEALKNFVCYTLNSKINKCIKEIE